MRDAGPDLTIISSRPFRLYTNDGVGRSSITPNGKRNRNLKFHRTQAWLRLFVHGAVHLPNVQIYSYILVKDLSPISSHTRYSHLTSSSCPSYSYIPQSCSFNYLQLAPPLRPWPHPTRVHHRDHAPGIFNREMDIHSGQFSIYQKAGRLEN